jgi:uncharacterized protein (DUF1499 family)
VGLFPGRRPDDLGVRGGRLKPVPTSPNAVGSQAPRGDDHFIEPLAYRGRREDAIAALEGVVAALPRTRIVARSDDYLHAECESALLGFVDDLEFHLPAEGGVIHVRSASRLGHSDLGVNRRRVEEIRARLARVLSPK